jgi:hypothetical protein
MVALHSGEDTGLAVGLKPGVMIARNSTERPLVDIKSASTRSDDEVALARFRKTHRMRDVGRP